MRRKILIIGITDNQTGDDTWRSTSGTTYNIDFSDPGVSLLSYAQYTVYSNTNLTGTTLKDWTNIATSIMHQIIQITGRWIGLPYSRNELGICSCV